MRDRKVVIWVDGASRGNPGVAAIGGIIKDERDKVLGRISRRIGVTTNNQAEYRAIIAALEKAIELGAGYVELRSDSELVVRQIGGRYRVKKAELKPLYQEVKRLQGQMEKCAFIHILRELNTEADKLANRALDSAVD